MIIFSLYLFKPFQKMTEHLSSNRGPNISISTAVYLNLYKHLEGYKVRLYTVLYFVRNV